MLSLNLRHQLGSHNGSTPTTPSSPQRHSNNNTSNNNRNSNNNNNNESLNRENHAFRRIMLIHIPTKFRLFDFAFPDAWPSNHGKIDNGITGFALSCLQLQYEFSGTFGSMMGSNSSSSSQNSYVGKFVLQPQFSPISEMLGFGGNADYDSASQQTPTNSSSTTSTTTTPTTSALLHHERSKSYGSTGLSVGFDLSSLQSSLSGTTTAAATTTSSSSATTTATTSSSSSTTSMNRKSMKHQSSVGGGLGNLNALAHQRLRQQQQQQQQHHSQHFSSGSNGGGAMDDSVSPSPLLSSPTNGNGGAAASSSSSSVMFPSSQSSNLLYFILATDPVFEKSKLVCALFLDGDDDWLPDARDFARRIVGQFTETHKDAIEKLKKVSEETEDEEEEEHLKLYSSFASVMHTNKLEVLSDRMKRRSVQNMSVVSESKHA